jgi:hypothetical protein
MQNVPLGPADSPHAVRRQRRLGRRLPVGGPLLVGAAGLLAALAGALLGSSPPQFTVGMDAAGYHLDGETLAADGPGTYRGAGGAALVVSRRGSMVRAAASTYLSGRHMVGECAYVQGADHESCLFTVGQSTVAATDTRTAGGWRRRYGDGQEVDLEVAGGGAVPVPFAVGR